MCTLKYIPEFLKMYVFVSGIVFGMKINEENYNGTTYWCIKLFLIIKLWRLHLIAKMYVLIFSTNAEIY